MGTTAKRGRPRKEESERAVKRMLVRLYETDIAALRKLKGKHPELTLSAIVRRLIRGETQ